MSSSQSLNLSLTVADIATHFRALFAGQFTKAERMWLLRAPLAPRSALLWSAFICRYFHRYADTLPPTRVLNKPLRNYGLNGLTPRHRVKLMLAHYRLLADLADERLVRAACSFQPQTIVTLQGKRESYRLNICNTTRLAMTREGELGLVLERADGLLLGKIALLLGEIDGKPMVAIGGLQGSKDGKRAVVAATRDLHGLRPKDALLLAVRSLATAFDIETIHAINNAQHVIERRTSDYDAYWLERGAEPGGPYGFVMPAQIATVETSAGRDLIKARLTQDASHYFVAHLKNKRLPAELSPDRVAANGDRKPSLVLGLC
ncbi:uncharacterized protein VirK/YbjX [Beijerinckia sp. GAS462]|nr:uncharacterized protein VirK/YbjX [Beijerinckia sp. GAS462]SEC62634.1 hypothetical protein SAMN05443249_3144 [Beijerinckia sp. 28-YEA-48]